ncbi:GH25 family lysozyme, partial [Salmonella enterica subsp. enterica serovar 1,4,[5],12:i:-]|nr:GH25 family lysozyme [Salmonella enterica subsp. enterica serovar 1,4,[5],12:i:-]
WDKVLLVLDLEENRQGKSMSAAEAEAFVQRVVSRARRYPVLYGGPYYLQGMTMGPGLRSCRLWVSHYTSASRPMIPRPWKFWALWQYTDGKLGGNPKSVSGVGNCDINRFNGTESQLRKRWPDLNSEDL